MSRPRRGHPNFSLFLDDVRDVNSGQVGRSNSLWLLSYRPLADLVVSNLWFNGAAGQISVVIRRHHLLPVSRSDLFLFVVSVSPA